MCWVTRYTAKCGCVWDEMIEKCKKVNLAPCCANPKAFPDNAKWANDYCRQHETLRRQFDAMGLWWGKKTEHGHGVDSAYAQFLREKGIFRDRAYYTGFPRSPYLQELKHIQEYEEREKNRPLLRMEDLEVYGNLRDETWYSFKNRQPQGSIILQPRFRGGPREGLQGLVSLDELFSKPREFRDYSDSWRSGAPNTSSQPPTTSSAAIFGPAPTPSSYAPTTSSYAPTASGYAPTASGNAPTTSYSATNPSGFAALSGQLARKRPPSPSQTAGLRTVAPSQRRSQGPDTSQQQANSGPAATSFGIGGQAGANNPVSQPGPRYVGPNTAGTVPWGTSGSRLPGRRVGEPSLGATSASMAPGASVGSPPTTFAFANQEQGFINPSMLALGSTNTSYAASISQSSQQYKPPSRVASPAIGSGRVRSGSPAPLARGSTPQYEEESAFDAAYWNIAREQSPSAPQAMSTTRDGRGSQIDRDGRNIQSGQPARGSQGDRGNLGGRGSRGSRGTRGDRGARGGYGGRGQAGS